MEPNFGQHHGYQMQRVAKQTIIEESVSVEVQLMNPDHLVHHSQQIPLMDAVHHYQQIPQMDLARYQPVYRAIRKRDWKSVEDFVNEDRKILDANITEFGQTIFHLLSQYDEAVGLLEQLISIVDNPEESLERENVDGFTALVIAAISGNTEGAKVLVGSHKKLLFIKHEGKYLPVHAAAYYSQKETVEYLISETAKAKDVVDLNGEDGSRLLKILIRSNLFGTALNLLKRYPDLAGADDLQRQRKWKENFERMARKPLLFASGNRLGFWGSFVYHYIPLQEEKNNYFIDFPLQEEKNPHLREGVDGDIEKQTDTSTNSSAESVALKFLQHIAATFGKLRHELNTLIWNALMELAPRIKRIHDQKLKHTQTLEIVRLMIRGVGYWNQEKAMILLGEAAPIATSLGIYEIVNEILKVYSFSVKFCDLSGDNLLNIAVLNRQEEVFNLIYQVCDPIIRNQITTEKNISGDTILHKAGVLAPSSEVPGAALQMQRELQWFKTVEDLCHPSLQGKYDGQEKTPREVFTQTHGVLVEKGEKWMKDTATSCSVVAALIITVVFTAAFTVPGGIDNKGRPIFSQELSFKIFAISNALALFSSTASVQMFLGILTSRYAEEDFLVSLPKKLIIGLITLFFSIASLMVAFAATFYIVISHPYRWVTFLIASLGTVPVTLFAGMQFPLLVDIFKSTYGPGIFKAIKVNDEYM